MMEFIRNAAAFLVAIGILVAFHEFGHFWVARKLGVKVLRYSVGFGKPLLMRKGRDGCEYVLAAIPLGGYVKMLDEREGEVAASEAHLAFNRQSPYKRFAIVAAGPLANFLLAIVFFWMVYVIGQPGMKPVLAEPVAQSAAAKAGVQSGEVITEVNGEAVQTWTSLRTVLLEKVVNREPLLLQLQKSVSDNSTRTLRVPLDAVRIEPEFLFEDLGLASFQPKVEPVIADVLPGSAGEKAGLLPGDRIVAIDDLPITEWMPMVLWVRAHPGAQPQLHIERAGQRMTLTPTIAARPLNEFSFNLRSFLGRFIPALKPDGSEATFGQLGAGPRDDPELRKLYTAQDHLSPGAAVPAAILHTWRTSVVTLKMLGKMVTGEVSLKNVSGAISIAQAAGYTASIGIATFLSFLALVSVSLGVLNLLPVPLLDGGHLVYYSIEIIKGSPLSEQVMAAGQRVGLTLLMLLMGLAFYNDLSRLIG